MKEWTKEQLDTNIHSNTPVFVYLYTPMCGTCQMAKKMLQVIYELHPDIALGMCDLNYIPEKAIEWAVESVPCLLIIENGQIRKRIYAFQSVQYLMEVVNEFKHTV